MKTLFNKEELAEMAIAPLDSDGTDIKKHLVARLIKNEDIKLLKMARKSTGLKINIFAPGMFYISYN